ncbi:adenosylcobinamide amidohydrolase [Halomarina pelagica]|uniref:adenosylcobinamide amidohydrolase n=1 Tax=Halomarina pelagica TaxID=2961599 RepID=UPI0020C232D4|nr:adenosylcobinamide amidohydrolase [Halomarina sp. BND7]
MYSTDATEGVCRLRADRRVRWLSSGWCGGFREACAAYNVGVPEGWPEVDLDAYADSRRERAGFDAPGPTLFTGVDTRHARGARLNGVVCLATAGVSNPASLPMEPREAAEATARADSPDPPPASSNAPPNAPPDASSDDEPPGTVNVLLGAETPLTEGALASLLGVVVEAKTAALLAETGFPGTTTDAAVVGCPPGDDPDSFAGSATAVGGAARACVREAVRASLASRYAEDGWELPETVAAAEYGVVTDERAAVFELG